MSIIKTLKSVGKTLEANLHFIDSDRLAPHGWVSIDCIFGEKGREQHREELVRLSFYVEKIDPVRVCGDTRRQQPCDAYEWNAGREMARWAQTDAGQRYLKTADVLAFPFVHPSYLSIEMKQSLYHFGLDNSFKVIELIAKRAAKTEARGLAGLLEALSDLKIPLTVTTTACAGYEPAPHTGVTAKWVEMFVQNGAKAQDPVEHVFQSN